jgi:hypothetical protein
MMRSVMRWAVAKRESSGVLRYAFRKTHNDSRFA